MTRGGGERSTLFFAAGLQKKGFQVTLLSDGNSLSLEELGKVFPFDGNGWKIKKIPDFLSYSSRFPGAGLLRKLYIYYISGFYDVFLNHHHQSLDPGRSRKNYYMIMFPFRSPESLLRKIYFQKIFLSGYQFLANSKFTAHCTEKFWGVRPDVLYPPVILPSRKTEKNPPGGKVRILSVGRFISRGHSKRQDVLIEAFKILSTKLPGTTLTLVGGLSGSREDLAYFRFLQEKAEGYSVVFRPDLSGRELESEYERAHLFWHAAGFEVPEEEPEKMEHFGMVTVEAMSYGTVPLVFPAGGQREIVENGSSGFFWKNVQELVEKSIEVLENLKVYSLQTRNRASAFSEESFNKEFAEIIEK